jgi:ATP-dependent exoDNAse (exonuclease V) beta subunit
MLRRNGELVEGKADMVVIDGARAVVVDYKTGYSGVPAEEIRAAYAGQLAAYRDAVKGAFGVTEAAAFLLLADRGELVEI